MRTNTHSLKTRVYLDYAASAPLRAEALSAQREFLGFDFADANPNSLHSMGREAARNLDESRARIAACLGGNFRPSEIIFCSGGTEANNLAVLGLARAVRAADARKNCVVMSAIEHDSVLDLQAPLRELGFDCEFLPCNTQGYVNPCELERFEPQTVALVSVMYANNEIGTIQPIAELADKAHQLGALFHTDAVQAFGHVPLDLTAVDAVSLAAHKLGAPKGIGSLALRTSCKVMPLSFGGGQEHGFRSGTQDVEGAYVFSRVAQACCAELEQSRRRCAAHAQTLLDKLLASGVFKASCGGVHEHTLPGIVHVYCDSLDSETLILGLDQAGYEVSAGSACSASSAELSHVVRALGLSGKSADGVLRISFDERVSEDDLISFADAAISLVQRLG